MIAAAQSSAATEQAMVAAMKARWTRESELASAYMDAARLFMDQQGWTLDVFELCVDLRVAGKPRRVRLTEAPDRFPGYFTVYNGRRTVMGMIRARGAA